MSYDPNQPQQPDSGQQPQSPYGGNLNPLMNNNGDNNLNSHMDSLGNLNSHPMGNLNGGNSLLRITLQHSMLHLLTAPSQPRVICHHNNPNGHDVVSGLR